MLTNREIVTLILFGSLLVFCLVSLDIRKSLGEIVDGVLFYRGEHFLKLAKERGA